MSELRLRVLTFNAHLMAGSNIWAGAWFRSKLPVTFQDEQRHNYIVGKIRESKADIVALQEVWANGRMDRIVRELGGDYPHAVVGDKGNGDFQALLDYVLHGLPLHGASSGIVLLSKYRIKSSTTYRFEGSHDDEERSASKGLIAAIIETPIGEISVAQTHAWTDAGERCWNISKLGEFAFTNGRPAIAMGDFNIHRLEKGGQSQKFVELSAIMSGFRARDSWTEAHGQGNLLDSVTDDQARNNLAQFFSPDRNTEDPDCIDYIYVKDDGSTKIRVESAKVLRDWQVSTVNQQPKWYWVHPGNVGGMPTAAAFDSDDKLCVVCRQVDGRMLASVIDRATKRWRSAIIKNGKDDVIAHGAPGMAWWEGTLHLFFRGANNSVMKCESRDGLNWSAPNGQGQDLRTSGGCAAVGTPDRLYVFVRDPNSGVAGNQILHHYWDKRGRPGWSKGRWCNLETDHNISAAVLGDRITVFARDPGDTPGGIMHTNVSVASGDPGPKVQIAAGASTSGSPGVVGYNGNFYVFYREPDGGGVHVRVSGNGWGHVDTTHQATNDEVCPVAFDGKVYLFFSYVVHQNRKDFPDKAIHPDDAVLYQPRAFAHAYWPIDVMLDASDHYPYQVDLVLTRE